MSRFVIITLLAIIATTSAKPYVVSYAPEYYDDDGYISPLYSSYDYPYNSYPYTPVTYVERAVVSDRGPPPPAPLSRIALPAAPPAPPPAPPAPPAPLAPPAPPAPAPAEMMGLDPAKLLAALPIAQLLELPPVKKIVALKSSKLEAILGLKSALQGKLATIASLLP